MCQIKLNDDFSYENEPVVTRFYPQCTYCIPTLNDAQIALYKPYILIIVPLHLSSNHVIQYVSTINDATI